ncbi:hypothetical protein ACVWYG_003460 [Pedobacter sp. UYEF25]
MKTTILLLCSILLSLSFTGCKKYLDVKPDQKLATISTLADMQAVLDDYAKINYSDPSMGEACGDNYFVSDATYNGFDEYDRNLYTWAPNNIFKPRFNVWNNVYVQVNIANAILEALNDNAATLSGARAADLSAQAYFLRGKAFYLAATTWCMPYNAATAAGLPGIPLRLTANFNEQSVRSTLLETYTQIVKDLKASAQALPLAAISPTRASKAAAFGMLARTYLQLHDYKQAGLYADSALLVQATLLDYNTLNAVGNFPMPKLNVEVIYEGRATTSGPVIQAKALLLPELYDLYNDDDLRKHLFFKASGSNHVFKGSYEAGPTLFNGITTAEMLLTRAECEAKLGFKDDALHHLNALLVNRYKAGTFIARTAADAGEALTMIRTERRKEMVFRCMRWLDIRRYNEEGSSILLSRTVEGEIFTLPPQNKRYALPIPEDVIEISGMKQNER